MQEWACEFLNFVHSSANGDNMGGGADQGEEHPEGGRDSPGLHDISQIDIVGFFSDDKRA